LITKVKHSLQCKMYILVN